MTSIIVISVRFFFHSHHSDGGWSVRRKEDRLDLGKVLLQVAWLEDDLDHERAGRTHGDVLLLLHVVDGDLEPVATRTRVGKELGVGVEGKVFDLDLVVYGLGHPDV